MKKYQSFIVRIQMDEEMTPEMVDDILFFEGLAGFGSTEYRVDGSDDTTPEFFA